MAYYGIYPTNSALLNAFISGWMLNKRSTGIACFFLNARKQSSLWIQGEVYYMRQDHENDLNQPTKKNWALDEEAEEPSEKKITPASPAVIKRSILKARPQYMDEKRDSVSPVPIVLRK